MRLLVTGAAGFIGSNFVRWILSEKKISKLVVYDLLTYAGNLANLEGLEPVSYTHLTLPTSDLV